MDETIVELTGRCDAHCGLTFAWIKAGTRGVLRAEPRGGLRIDFPGGYTAFVIPAGTYPRYRVISALEQLAEVAE